MNNQTNKRAMLFCEVCCFKKIIETPQDVAGLVEIKTTNVQMKVPQLDPATGKTVAGTFTPQAKKYKCPKCGRGVKVKELLKSYSDALKAIDEEKLAKQREEERKRRIEDGKPVEKKVNPDFLG